MDSHAPTLLNENFYKFLLDSIFDAVYTVDVDGRIVYWNESCERITGYTAEETETHQRNKHAGKGRIAPGRLAKPGKQAS